VYDCKISTKLERVIMLYPVFLFVIAGLFGTLLALRLMAIDAQEQRSSLTRRGRIVVGISWGIVIALIVVVINGSWWNCDTATCSFVWGY
jgi:succinate dehydrogenase/fumarate reductase cytochrome b subunit